MHKKKRRDAGEMMAEARNSYVEAGKPGTLMKVGVAGSGTERGEFRGVNRGKDADHPRVSTSDYAALQEVVAGVGVDGVFFYALSGLCKPGSKLWDSVTEARVGARVQEGDHGIYTVKRSVVPRAGPIFDDGDTSAGVRTYQLAHVLSDSYVQGRYELSKKAVADLRMLAVNAPGDAALSARELIQAQCPGVKIKVVVGNMANSVRAAVECIKMASAGCVCPPSGFDSRVFRTDLFVYVSDDVKVRGPLGRAASVADFSSIVMRMGAHEAVHVFGLETAQLGIEVMVGDRVVSSEIVGHMKPPGSPVRVPDASGELVDELRPVYEKLCGNILPVGEAKQGQVASAVRLDSRAVVVNDHVCDSLQNPTVAEVAVSGGSVAGSDLWAYKHLGTYHPWVYRRPEAGEYAVILYSDGNGVRMSPKFRVVRSDAVHVVSEGLGVAVQGMSGGAVVGLRDLALFGVHRGENRLNLLATAVDSTLCAELAEYVAGFERPEGDAVGEELAASFHSRGLLGRFQANLSACVPVYGEGGETGTSVNVDGSILTTCPQDFVKSHRLYNRSGFVNACDMPGEKAECVRKPVSGEEVVLAGVDDQGHFLTQKVVVKAVGVGARSFILSDYGRVLYQTRGMVVISTQDAAILGMLVRRTRDVRYGTHLVCAGVPERIEMQEDVLPGLQRIFPQLSIHAWEPVLVEECFTHSSFDGVSQLDRMAMYGRASIACSVAYKSLETYWDAQRVNEQTAYHTQVDRLADMSVKLGLPKLVRAGVGVDVAHSKKASSALFCAFMGLVKLHESEEQFDSIMSKLGGDAFFRFSDEEVADMEF